MKTLRWIVVCVSASTLISACGGLTRPDGDDWAKLVASVSGLSEAARGTIIRYAMNRKAIEFLEDRPPTDPVGGVTCLNADTHAQFEVGKLTVLEVMQCLLDPTNLYAHCVGDLLSDLAKDVTNSPEAKAKWGNFYGCEPYISPLYGDLSPDELRDPAAWDNDEIARAVLRFPPPQKSTDPQLVAAMAALAAAVEFIAPALCALDAQHWACDTSDATTGGSP